MTDREEYKSQYPDRVKVIKNGDDVGWYKNIESGVNNVKSTCEVHGFDISHYEFRSAIDDTVVWRGSDEK